jgi:hypothetical protein
MPSHYEEEMVDDRPEETPEVAQADIPEVDPEEKAAFVEETGKSEKALKEDFRMFRAKAMKLAHSKGHADKIMQALAQGNKIQSLATVTFTIADRVSTAMRKSGNETPDQIIAVATLDVMGQMIELAEESGVQTYTPEEKQAAFSEVVNMYFQKEMKEGRVDKEELAMQLGRDVKAMSPEEREMVNAQLEAINTAATGSRQVSQFNMQPNKPGQPAPQAPPNAPSNALGIGGPQNV